MYSNESILSLIDRIGWEESLNSDVAIAINVANKTATSGRKVNSFHSLASVDNIYSAVPEVNMDVEKFNEFLSSVREQSVKEVLTTILDQHHLYDETIDYSNIIDTKSRLFDDAIGYTIAIKMLELFISTTRKNLTERSASLSFNVLKVELEGAKNEKGHLVANGIIAKKELAVRKSQEIIFPNPPTVTAGSKW